MVIFEAGINPFFVGKNSIYPSFIQKVIRRFGRNPIPTAAIPGVMMLACKSQRPKQVHFLWDTSQKYYGKVHSTNQRQTGMHWWHLSIENAKYLTDCMLRND